MSSILFSKKDIKWHLLVWVLITFFVCLIDPVESTLKIQIIGTFLIMIAYMFVYYMQYLYLLKFFNKNNIIKFLILVICLFIIFITINFLNFHYILSVFNFGSKIDYPLIFDWITSCFIIFSIVSIIAYGFYQNKISIYELQKEYEKEKIVLNKELGFYKNQFNPHITFNFLNYCYSFVNQKSPETAEVIEIYSEMLRYTIQCKPDETVPLKDEVDYLSKFISLKKQLTKGVFVEFDVKGDLFQKQILPRLLITFLENAFKHGDTHCEENPIRIKIETTDDEIIFKVSNKKILQKNKLTSTGIGQLNVKNQLDLFYKDKHELIINEKNIEFYSTTLKIKLN